MTQPLAVVAIGGNSLIKDNSKTSVQDQYEAAAETAQHIASLVAAGYRVVITHGNGPQVGFILLRSDLAKHKLHEVPLDNCVADTQGSIGYQVGQTLANELRRRNGTSIATVVTQVMVAANDRLCSPTKPIGPFTEEAQKYGENGWVLKKMPDAAGGAWSPPRSPFASLKKTPSVSCCAKCHRHRRRRQRHPVIKTKKANSRPRCCH